ncbi:tRNA pseudouridine(38-40) synthase TruA [Nocardioides antri]|uniref:tRNA pseudouridine synthase A n=1 Tax=Nocardioides antri TaxID=2607659 RepID=A0A5B1M6A5_9ACTN|nr:tRNA pseudouridine(38-40) synthase TruA [Nocardioides antri]KAA1427327.1 tRNA pseudouridine(38-40) synthase TruA [Nocardioides antri]
MRLRIDLAYDGTAFHGWAAQPALRTVQGELTAALATVLRRPAGELQVVCAGRTDAGVHARGQVAHVDLADDPGDLEQLARRVNGVLPADARVHRIAVAPPGFDARFGALWRRYAYRIADDPAAVDPLHRHHVLAWPRRLDLDAMNQAAATLVGLHDFASFCKQRPGATTIRTLLGLSWSRDDAGVAVGRVKADAFCHSMVRALVGCLVAVGEGRRPPEWAQEILMARRRDSAVAVLHAHGLTLEEVAYPPDHELAARAELTAARREATDP